MEASYGGHKFPTSTGSHIINRKEDGSLRFAILVLVVNFLKLSAMELVLSKMSKNFDV